jgi:seryl-tRNA(Sec) selenium transferase
MPNKAARPINASQGIRESRLQERPAPRRIIVPTMSGGRQPAVGGGSLPEQTFPTVVIALKAHGPSDAELARTLRLADPPVVPRIQDGLVLLDLRGVFPEQDSLLVQAVSRACTNATA